MKHIVHVNHSAEHGMDSAATCLFACTVHIQGNNKVLQTSRALKRDEHRLTPMIHHSRAESKLNIYVSDDVLFATES